MQCIGLRMDLHRRFLGFSLQVGNARRLASQLLPRLTHHDTQSKMLYKIVTHVFRVLVLVFFEKLERGVWVGFLKNLKRALCTHPCS